MVVASALRAIQPTLPLARSDCTLALIGPMSSSGQKTILNGLRCYACANRRLRILGMSQEMFSATVAVVIMDSKS